MSAIHDLDEFAYGDVGTDTLLKLVDEDGDPIDLNGSESLILRCQTTAGEEITISGTATTIEIDDESILCGVLLEDLGTCVTPDATRPAIYLVGRLEWTQASEFQKSRDRVRFSVVLK